MDVVWPSRLQSAAATYFHFLFVPLTLTSRKCYTYRCAIVDFGLSLLIALMGTRFAR